MRRCLNASKQMDLFSNNIDTWDIIYVTMINLILKIEFTLINIIQSFFLATTFFAGYAPPLVYPVFVPVFFFLFLSSSFDSSESTSLSSSDSLSEALGSMISSSSKTAFTLT